MQESLSQVEKLPLFKNLGLRVRGVSVVAVSLNHTIVHSLDKHAAATFLARILGLREPFEFGHFVTVNMDNEVSLDFDNAKSIRPQHYAFLVDDQAFDTIFARIQGEGLPYFADPAHRQEGMTNTWNPAIILRF